MVSKGRKYNYEAMFLLSQAQAADLGAAVEHLKEVIKHAGAELLAMKKWDERRLAYEVDKQKRGTYILSYFASDPVNVASIERSCNLSERILRTLITRCDHLTLDQIKATDGQQDLATEAELRRGRAAAAESTGSTTTVTAAPAATTATA